MPEGTVESFTGLNESPSEKEGKYSGPGLDDDPESASMKVPPKRKGNSRHSLGGADSCSLNESPSEKEGKYPSLRFAKMSLPASMKVPPKRKGNTHP